MKLTIGNDFKDTLQAVIDKAADDARLAVVGNSVRMAEYNRAQAHAEQYRDQGYEGDVPASVASWALAKNWSAEEAAKDIIRASVQWIACLDMIRQLRLVAKEEIKLVATKAEADVIYAGYSATLSQLMQGVS